jgi:hypothetical protein
VKSVRSTSPSVIHSFEGSDGGRRLFDCKATGSEDVERKLDQTCEEGGQSHPVVARILPEFARACLARDASIVVIHHDASRESFELV